MRIKISFLLIIISGLYFANAQSNKLLDNTNLNYIEFKGKVINSENNEPLIFANINLLESNISTISNGDGDFAIKIPKSHTSSKVQISFIGFKTRILNLKSLNKKNNTISLDVFITPLSETVLSIPKDVERLVRETLANVERNYIEDHTLMTAFYRETIKKKRRNVSLSEAVVNIYKAPYKTYQKRDGIKILKIRKDTDYSRLDTVAFKLSGGPYNTLFQDIIKYSNYFIPPFLMSNYTFWVHRNSKINDMPVYVIRFKQKDNIYDPLFYGELYIDGENKILLSATYSLNVSNRDMASKLFVKKKPRNAKVWPVKVSYRVDYAERNNKWHYSYSNASIDFKVNWDKKIFNSTYSLSSEMAITDWTENETLNFPKRKDLVDPSVILADSKIGFKDLNFWGEDNIIEPENTIQNAIKKIQRKLKRLKD
ncbi:MAG: carboxypeptidase-like regulatory domain-containing protein [Flavobacteriaceae bacterium]|nr:carboxypeptidase-like regulatory domain-containing protein [Flavobacteriaceae bacterium]